MIKRALSLAILFAMVLHCANRLGGLSYLYEKRNDIAYAVGLIAEKPIAVCSSDYDYNRGLTVVTPEHDPGVRGFVPSYEINLFVIAFLNFPQPAGSVLIAFTDRHPADQYSLNPIDSIFHPPLA